jgi:uncharacterized membrane protein
MGQSIYVVGDIFGIFVSHLSSFVLGDLVLGVLPALPALAVRPASFRDVDLKETTKISMGSKGCVKR